MNTMLIQYTNEHTTKLLRELEELNLIKVIERNVKPKRKLSEKYAGKLSNKVASEMQSFIAKSRNEWNQKTI